MCMIDQGVRDVIDTVVGLWTGQGRAFTAYEVSLEVQGRLKEKGEPFVRHMEMVDYYRHGECQPLQDVIGNGTYKATLRSMGQNLEAFVYHPYNYDPTNYTPLPRDKNVGVPPAQVPSGNLVTNVVSVPPVLVAVTAPAQSNGNTISSQVATSVVVPSVPSDPDVVVVNKSGELWIGCGYVQQAGFHPGHVTEVAFASGEVTLSTYTGTNGSSTKRVEAYGNMRLYPQERIDAGLTGTQFRIEAEPGKITVREA